MNTDDHVRAALRAEAQTIGMEDLHRATDLTALVELDQVRETVDPGGRSWLRRWLIPLAAALAVLAVTGVVLFKQARTDGPPQSRATGHAISTADLVGVWTIDHVTSQGRQITGRSSAGISFASDSTFCACGPGWSWGGRYQLQSDPSGAMRINFIDVIGYGFTTGVSDLTAGIAPSAPAEIENGRLLLGDKSAVQYTLVLQSRTDSTQPTTGARTASPTT